MWSAVAPPPDAAAPSSRSKHSATLLGGHVFLLGGRNGNLPLKDLWRYSLADGRWEQLQPSGERPPCLQEHTAVAYKDCLYVFGGEVGFSAGTETPLWVYHVKGNSWRKVRSQKGVVVPRGRRGHSALVHRGTMLVYGGYQDLRGSSSELWGFHFDTESWHLLCGRGASSGDAPPARHKHSAVLHDDVVWVYGGMTDLQERADLWRWDTVSRSWGCVRSKPGPGPLHSHAACKLPSSMLLFGGERDGQPTGELWRFHFGTEAWERVQVSGPRPRARSESVALAVSELLLSNLPPGHQPGGQGAFRGHHRPRGGGSVDRSTCHGHNPRHLVSNRVSPCDDKQPTMVSYLEGGRRRGAGGVVVSANGGGFLREISKLSQINLSRLSHHKCSYSVLTSSSHDESTESLLLQNSTTSEDASHSSKMVKSQSANLLTRRNPPPSLLVGRHNSALNAKSTDSSSSSSGTLPRDPLSVPNFGTLLGTSIPAPVLTPVEITRLVYFDTDDELENDVFGSSEQSAAKVSETSPHVEFSLVHQRFQPAFQHDRRSDSYSSHLISAGEKSRSRNCDDAFDEMTSTSDYASIASASNYSMCNRASPVETQGLVDPANGDGQLGKGSRGGVAKTRAPSKDGVVGFCNPNYLGPDIQTILAQRKSWHVTPAKMLNSPPDSLLEDANGRSISRELVEMRAMDRKKKSRASSASRAEHSPEDKDNGEDVSCFTVEPPVSLHMFVMGGKEQGQVTVFKRPMSVWKLQLAPNIY